MGSFASQNLADCHLSNHTCSECSQTALTTAPPTPLLYHEPCGRSWASPWRQRPPLGVGRAHCSGGGFAKQHHDQNQTIRTRCCPCACYARLGPDSYFYFCSFPCNPCPSSQKLSQQGDDLASQGGQHKAVMVRGQGPFDDRLTCACVIVCAHRWNSSRALTAKRAQVVGAGGARGVGLLIGPVTVRADSRLLRSEGQCSGRLAHTCFAVSIGPLAAGLAAAYPQVGPRERRDGRYATLWSIRRHLHQI